ncbi:MAG: hypothetical protein QM490_03825 [Candidatus Gracilibacteria bacterium]
MNKIVYFILFTLLFLFSSNIVAGNIEYNTESNIKKALLVEDYLSRHKGKIDDFIKKYNIFNNSNLLSDLNELDESIKALKKIQNTDIEKQKAEEVILAVINRIKRVNESLKIQLEIEKDIFERNLKSKKNAFSKLGIKIANKINSINLKIAQNIFKDKQALSPKESKIKQNLIKLNKESLKLKNFGNINFKSEEEIKDVFVRILQNIKIEINSMKETLK